MFKLISALVVIYVSSQICLGWNTRTCFVDHRGYTRDVFQELMHEIENDVKLCNLNVRDFNRTINDRLYTFRVSGQVHYTNSFLISIQRVNINTNIPQMSRRVTNNVTEYEALITATMNIMEPKFGFDVRLDLTDGTTHTSTSTFTYDSITYTFYIQRHMNTNVTTVTTHGAGQSSRFRTMQFHPDTNYTQVLSRHFQGFDIGNDFSTWGREIFVPRIHNIAVTKVAFPEVRFDGCN